MPLLVTRQKLLRFTNRAPWYLRPLFQYVLSAYGEMYVDTDIPKHCKMASTMSRDPNQVLTFTTFQIDEHLAKNPWFARGSDGPTSADYAMIIGLEALITGNAITSNTHPAIGKYVEKVHVR